jgi:hypothetical protein
MGAEDTPPVVLCEIMCNGPRILYRRSGSAESRRSEPQAAWMLKPNSMALVIQLQGRRPSYSVDCNACIPWLNILSDTATGSHALFLQLFGPNDVNAIIMAMRMHDRDSSAG